MKQRGSVLVLLLIGVLIFAVITGLYFLINKKDQSGNKQANTTNSSLNSKTATESNTAKDTTATSVPKSPITLKLSISKPPALGEQATLDVSIISTEPAPKTTVSFNLTDGYKLVSGLQIQTVDLKTNQEQKLSPVVIKAAKEGYWTISVFAKHTVSEEPVYWFGDTKYLGLYVGEKNGGFGTPPSSGNEEKTIQVTPPVTVY